MSCPSVTQTGAPCRARPTPGRKWCRMHDPSPSERAKHRKMSRRGGESKAYGGLPAATPMQSDLGSVDLGTAEGARQLVSVALRRLAALPFSERTAHAVAALVGTQRQLIETVHLEQRLLVLEQDPHARLPSWVGDASPQKYLESLVVAGTLKRLESAE